MRPTRRLALVLFLGLSACSKGERREWRPSDHAQPPGVTASAPASAAAPPSPEVARLRAGAALFTSRCATCHGPEGRGDGEGAPPMARPVDLTSADWQGRHSDELIATIIRTGRGAMPAFGSELDPTAVDALVAFVRTLSAGR